MSILDTFIWYVSTFWFTIPIAAVIIFLLIMETMRNINNMILYIRASEYGGGTMELLKCIQQGTNLSFYPEKNDKQVVHIDSDPYIWVRGTATMRIYVVVQGSGKTTTFPFSQQVFEDPAAMSAISKVADGIDANKSMTDKEKEAVKKLFGTVSIGSSGSDPKIKAAAASISFFERFTVFLAQNLPKGKGDYMMIIVYIALGVLIGLPFGMLIIMKGIW